jgi:hypothetical protein
MDTRAFRHTCHHEAGHAFMRWFVGIDTDFVEVLPRGVTAMRYDEDRAHRYKAGTVGPGISHPKAPSVSGASMNGPHPNGVSASASEAGRPGAPEWLPSKR